MCFQMMDFMKALFTKKTDKPCGLCGGVIQGKPAFLNYKIRNEDTHDFDYMQMEICSLCENTLDETLKKVNR